MKIANKNILLGAALILLASCASPKPPVSSSVEESTPPASSSVSESVSESESVEQHSYGAWIEQVDSTCSTEGVLGHYHCTHCNKDFDAEYVELPSLVIEKKAHTPVTVTGTAPTHDENGLTDGVKCSVCDEWITPQENIPATGHTYEDTWTYDETHHWHKSTCGHDIQRGYAKHTFEISKDGTKNVCTVCSAEFVLITSLEAPTNLTYENRVFSFNPVANAERYIVTLTKGNTQIKSWDIKALNVNLPEEVAPGYYSFNVIAKRGTISSPKASLQILVLYVDSVSHYEAENAVINEKHISVDPAAEGGKYAIGFDDCGQGLYFRHYAYEAGVREVSVRYATGAPGSYMNMSVNGGEKIKVLFSENTGWFGDSKKFATAVVSASFNQGWNEINLLKDGNDNDSPAYGGWAQIDYLEVAGSEKEFDLKQFDKTIKTYKLEAEMAAWHWGNTNLRPAVFPDLSMGYGLGNMDAEGDGVSFHVQPQSAGKYKVQLGYGGQNGATPIKISIDGGEPTAVEMSGSTAWNNIVPSVLSSSIEVYLQPGQITKIDFIRNGQWFVADYLLLTKI